jgi:ATP-dependent protease ClpP protease subunit
LGEYCGKDAEQVKQDASRDLWLDSEQALEYGIIDTIVKTKKNKCNKNLYFLFTLKLYFSMHT